MLIASASLVLFVAATAAAQGTTAIAEGLFRDGKKLLDQKHYAEACPKFEESARIDPSSGVELALGLCYEGLGKTASAWGAYQSAVSLARRDNRKDREHVAFTKAAALEPKLAHVTLDITSSVAELPGLQVKEDSAVIGAAAWRNAPIDPGSHTLEVTATGKKPWSTTFTIDNTGGTKTVSVPAVLEEQPEAVGLQAKEDHVVVVEQRAPNPFRTAAFVTVGAGAVTIVAASILGGIAIADASDAHKACPNATCTDTRAISENNTAGSLADWSTALFVVSGVCFAASVVLFLLKPPSSSVRPVVGLGSLGIQGVF
jgi:hypothetical protein